MAACSPSQRLRPEPYRIHIQAHFAGYWLLFRPAAADRMILPRRANCWGVLYRRTRVSNPCCSSGDNSTTGGFGPRIAFTTTLHLSNLNALIILLGLFSPPVLVVYPYFFFVELLAPVLEAVGLIILVVGLAVGAVNGPFAALFFAAAYGYGLLLTMLSLLLEEIFYRRYQSWQDRMWLITWTILENFGYRQLTVLWRLRGLVQFPKGSKGLGHHGTARVYPFSKGRQPDAIVVESRCTNPKFHSRGF